MEKSMMPIEHIPDWEQRLERQDAFWSMRIIDRPVVNITIPKTNPKYPFPKPKTFASHRDQWMDTEYMAERALAGVMNTEYIGDALPCVWPNLGPEIFSAFFGCELEYGESTSWSIPNLWDWSNVSGIKFSEDNFYWKKIVEMTDALLETGKGIFYTGITDLHPGGDAMAALRDPARLNLDMIENTGRVKALLAYVNQIYFQVYDFYYSKLTGAQQPVSTWAGIVSTRKWYVPSNDFSCMISKQMFDDVFLPGIVEECGHTEASIYHLDGPQALRHLTSLLQIKELNAIQWIFGAGHGRACDWISVYKQCQAAGKGLQVWIDADELDVFMERLRPGGLWLAINGVQSREHAESIIKKISSWR